MKKKLSIKPGEVQVQIFKYKTPIMTEKNRYFFCGIGGSGMLPLALILLDQGHTFEGSDRSLDKGRTRAKFDYLRSKGIRLFPQGGSGVTSPDQVVVPSAAVEDTLPDMANALRAGAKWMNSSLA